MGDRFHQKQVEKRYKEHGWKGKADAKGGLDLISVDQLLTIKSAKDLVKEHETSKKHRSFSLFLHDEAKLFPHVNGEKFSKIAEVLQTVDAGIDPAPFRRAAKKAKQTLKDRADKLAPKFVYALEDLNAMELSKLREIATEIGAKQNRMKSVMV